MSTAEPSPPTSSTPEPVIAARLSWLEQQDRLLARTGRRVAWSAATLVFAVPAGLVWGAVGSLIVVAIVATVVIVASYVVWAHRHEYATERDGLLARLRAVPLEGHRAPDPSARAWRVPGKATQL